MSSDVDPNDAQAALRRLSELEQGFREDVGYVPKWVRTAQAALRPHAEAVA